MISVENEQLVEMIGAISKQMASRGDINHAQKTQQISSKLTDGRLTIALCGHFSAGKSTLVNTLCGAKLLPSSPIPTSANVVTLSGGLTPRAEVEVMHDGVLRHDEVAIEELDSYCKDGEKFSSVSIIYPSELLGNDLILLDTPGIDSTDAAHKLATESALHMADVVFYVMDYNHVQSEINFSFAKQLKDWGKPVYFLVNQIDKHREHEIAFDQYKESVTQAFHAWHLEPAGIIYLSLRQPDHPHHEWEKLIALIQQLKLLKALLYQFSVQASLRQLTEEHLKWVAELNENAREQLLQEAGGEEVVQSFFKEQEELLQQQQALKTEVMEKMQYYRKSIQSILDNANITPAPLRDDAHLFLESQKPGFKAGLLFAKNKTNAEKESRTLKFHQELISLVQAAIEWHLNVILREAASKLGYNAEELESRLTSDLTGFITPEYLIQKVNSGSVFGNEYTINYCKELSHDIKAEYRRRAYDLLEIIISYYQIEIKDREYEIASLLEKKQQQSIAISQFLQFENQMNEYGASLRNQVQVSAESPKLPDPDKLVLQSDALNRDELHAMNKVTLPSQPIQPIHEYYVQIVQATENAAIQNSSMKDKQQSTALTLMEAANKLAQFPRFESFVHELRDKAKRLEHNQFTLALFGAFSAGKSSLANALIGEAVLPVSPNPTTASINSLLPPQGEAEHNTAHVIMKSKQTVIEDLIYSLTLLGETVPDPADEHTLFAIIDQLSPDSIHSGGRAHYSFVRAARMGWLDQEEWLGKTRHVNRDLYVQYVAEESYSCFVQEIKFYYSCPLTDAGIVLVDTPGADSVNARHTGVSFNYIKNADAILFVTYYNHAFSHADRQFLDQLGRVKDQFELDKMFFIVNAADLAQDGEELKAVMEHVRSNLEAHRILKAKLYPVSSLQGLEAKLQNNKESLHLSGLSYFEQHLYSFIHQDLGDLAIDAAKLELSRIKDHIKQLKNSAAGDQASKALMISKLEEAYANVLVELHAYQASSLPQQVKQEIEELMYYIVQRIGFRLGDFYNASFNPAVLRSDVQDMNRALWMCFQELQKAIAVELSQELLATTMRIEKHLHGTVESAIAEQNNRIIEKIEGFSWFGIKTEEKSSPSLPNQWTYDSASKKWLSNSFKSPKYFFEGEGKAKLRKELEALFIPSIQEWMEQVSKQWQHHYEWQWNEMITHNMSLLGKDLEQFVLTKLQILRDEQYLKQLQLLDEQLNTLNL